MPGYPFPYINRALIERRHRDYEGAFKDIDRSLAVDPWHAMTYAFRGYFQYDLSQFPAALESFLKAVQLDTDNFDYRYRLWLIRSRLGERAAATKELTEELQSWPAFRLSKWPIPIERYLVGTISEDDLQNQAKACAINARLEQSYFCDAYYYIGMKHLLDGDKAGAMAFLQKAVDTGVIPNFAYDSAQADLAALKKQ
jgi:lipoprotein NlpI